MARSSLPDEEIIAALRKTRGRDRNEYPVEAGSPSGKRGYNRGLLEWVCGFEGHFIRGLVTMRTRIGLAFG